MNNYVLDLHLLRQLCIPPLRSKAPVPISIRWQPPPDNWIKVNIEGSFSCVSNQSGVGGIFRNKRGFPMGCFSFPTGHAPAFEVELRAAIFAIMKA